MRRPRSTIPTGRYDVVVNVQGDLPTLDPPKLVAASVTPLADPAVDIATVVARITLAEELTDAAVVKAAVSFQPGATIGPGTAVFQPQPDPVRARRSLSPHRHLCLPPRELAALRQPEADGVGAA